MSDLDDLMDKDLPLSRDDLQKLVAYHRKNREAGPRPKKETGPQPTISLTALGLVKPSAPSTPIKRRI